MEFRFACMLNDMKEQSKKSFCNFKIEYENVSKFSEKQLSLV